MASVISTNTWFQAQSKVLKQVFIKSVPEAPPLFRKFFNIEEPDQRRSFFQVLPIVGFGALALKPEGSAPLQDQAYEGIASMFPFLTYSLKYAITKEGQVEDAMNINARLPRALRFAEDQTKEFLIWNVLNQAFATGVTLFDGLPLCSTGHPLGGSAVNQYGTYSNSLGATALTPESLQNAFILLETLPDDRALNTYRTPKMLVIPPQLHKTGEEILGSSYYPYSNENRINVVQDKIEPLVCRYLTQTSPPGWFVTAGKGDFGTDAHTCFASFKWEYAQRTWLDENTNNLFHATETRLTWGAVDGRGIVGSQGA